MIMGIFDRLWKKSGREGKTDNTREDRTAKGIKKQAENNRKSEKDIEIRAAGRENVQGWEAVTKAFELVYPAQKDPKHYGTLIKWRLGGRDPLDGISVYDGGDYWHFVTYGLSELYEKESENKEISGYGMEFTLKLQKSTAGAAASGKGTGYIEAEEAEIRCICGILQTIARLTFTDGEMFLPYEYLYTGQKEGMDACKKSNITGFITIPDRDVKPIVTPNGSVEFVEFIGVTDAEVSAVHRRDLTVKELYERLGTDVTSYGRESVV